MKHILIIGANGTIGSQVTARLLQETNAHITLFLRQASRITVADAKRETVVEGNATDSAALDVAMQNQDIVFSTLGGDTEHVQQATAITDAMRENDVQRLIWITGIGIEDELVGKFNDWEQKNVGDLLPISKQAAQVIEASGLNYTLLRCAWMTNDPEIDYETSTKGTIVTNTLVSRSSVSDLVLQLMIHEDLDNHANIAVFQPGTEADHPAGY